MILVLQCCCVFAFLGLRVFIYFYFSAHFLNEKAFPFDILCFFIKILGWYLDLFMPDSMRSSRFSSLWFKMYEFSFISIKVVVVWKKLKKFPDQWITIYLCQGWFLPNRNLCQKERVLSLSKIFYYQKQRAGLNS